MRSRPKQPEQPVFFEMAGTRNAVLGALGAEEVARLQPHLRAVDFALGAVLGEMSEPVDTVLFPEAGMISCILDSNQNTGVEFAVVGREGALGVLDALSNTPRLAREIVQAAGWGWALPAPVLREEFARGGALQSDLLSYLKLSYAMAAVTGLCNRLHTIEERLSRWLLITRNGSESDEFDLEPSYLAAMLGSRLSGVPIALGVLHQAGLISVDGARIRLLDVPAVEASACECHSAMAAQLEERFRNA
jgi:CRP-like cAMP-binding protein